ncbi:MAG: hypothetical protein JSR71_09440 [Proteobacteria bacterium]|nr:hypothetical protein [Pseudomonadota bacterium]
MIDIYGALKKKSVTRYVNGSITDYDGNIIPAPTPQIYQLGGQPYPWDVPVGTVVGIDASCLSGGSGARLHPIELVNDGTIWQPNGEQILYSSYGSYSSPAALITTVSGENLFFSSNPLFKIPYGLLHLGIGMRIRFVCYKPDADTGKNYFRVRIGNSSVAVNNTQVLQVENTTTNHEQLVDVTMRVTGLGDAGQASLTSTGIGKLFTSAATSSDSAGTLATNYATSSDNYIVLSTLANNVGAKSSLVNFSISLVP